MLGALRTGLGSRVFPEEVVFLRGRQGGVGIGRSDGGGLGAVALVAILFLVYGGTESSDPPPRTDVSLDAAQGEFSDDGRISPARDRGALTSDEGRSRLAAGADDGTADAAGDEDDAQAKKKKRRKSKKRGRKTSGGEEEEEEEPKSERRLPKPTDGMLEGP